MSSDASSPTVFVVDDEPSACDSVCALAASLGYHARGFSSAEKFLRAYDPAVPGCLVTDLRLLGMSGAELQDELLRRGVRIPTIVISGYADVPMTVSVMRKGALTLLSKPFDFAELADAIRHAVQKDLRDRQHQARMTAARERLAKLSADERLILRLLVEGFSNKQIAHQLELGLRTVERRRHEIFTTLEISSIAEAVRLLVLLDPTYENAVSSVDH